MKRNYNLTQLRTKGEKLFLKFLYSTGATIFGGFFVYLFLVFIYISDFPLSVPLNFLLFLGIIGSLFIFLAPLIYYIEKLNERIRTRRDTLVIDELVKQLIENRETLNPIEERLHDYYEYKIGLCLLEYEKLAKIYPLNNPMKYISKAIQKYRS